MMRLANGPPRKCCVTLICLVLALGTSTCKGSDSTTPAGLFSQGVDTSCLPPGVSPPTGPTSPPANAPPPTTPPRITSEGATVVTTIAGSGTSGYTDGSALLAQFAMPSGIAVDGKGNIYVADTINQRIRRLSPDGTVSTLAGNDNRFLGPRDGPRKVDGTGTTALFGDPLDLVLSGENLYVVDTNQIRRITLSGVVTTFAGSPIYGYADGSGTNARFASISGLATDRQGNLYAADSGGNTIRRIDTVGHVTTVAGNGIAGCVDGPVASATFENPSEIVVDANGNLYVAQYAHPRIRKISATGQVTTIGGDGTFGGDDGTGLDANILVGGIAVDADNNLLIADGNNRIRKVTPDGVVTTLAGGGGSGYRGQGFADGTGTGAHFNGPTGIALDPQGNIYVADSGNQRIRKLSR